MKACNCPVTLEEVLENREARVERQRDMLSRASGGIVSFTVNIPGPVKDTDDSRFIFTAGVAALERAAANAGMTVAERRELFLPTGPEGIFSFEAEAAAIKKTTIAIEDEHPLGRFFDLDVLGADGAPVSRSLLAHAPRVCFVCGGPAAVCARSRAHSVDALNEVVRKRVAAFRKGVSCGV